jgi:signal transduction histidine kinase
MTFLKNIDYLKMIQFAMGISIFSIGYLITMSYFQVHNLKEYKQLIVFYNNANVNMLHLELEIQRDSYLTQDELLNQNILFQKENQDTLNINSFFEKKSNVKEVDSEIIQAKSEIKNLIKRYQDAKIQLFKKESNGNVRTFNLAVIALRNRMTNYIDYLESKVSLCDSNYEQLISSSKNSSFLIVLISLVLFILSYAKMNGDVNKLKKVNDDLLFLNKTLSNAEMIAGFGSWKVNVFKNTYHFSDNFYRLIGVMPNEFDAELNNVMDYIHPEDREEVLKQHKESFVTEKNSTIVYRYLLSDGTIKHMESVGKFMHNAKGELVKIGVNRDVTELMKKSTELEEKNEKLIAINSELESFNNIVGHDLQEPLRKIQMFISRIESNEFKETASETTVLYFEKIKTSAQRMQNLMTDLVDYTRTIKGDRIFERIDLNLILEEIIDELSSTIEEKNAIITVDNLPSIVGTRFQIQQLFTNLISNSLKYLTPYVTPIIRVQLENFNKEVVNDKFIFGKDYYKITVTDNGIGFEQKYADIIFMLFKRLATDLSYEGTGLGLAICKKIVDSNNGLITANGVPNVGSIFSIYLPKNNTVKR